MSDEDSSAVETSTYTYLSRNGRYYATYQAMRDANVLANQQRLQSLGLDKTFQDSLRPKPRASPRPTVARTPVNPNDLRRSKRVRNVTPEDTGLLPEQEEALRRATAARPNKQRRRAPVPAMECLSAEDRKQLRDLPDWTADMELYLTKVEALSRPNFLAVMRQVEKMVSGAGIGYGRWDEGVMFGKGRAVELGDDMEALYDEAVEFENEHGRDLGNGWLLRHPIKKLANFQRYYFEERMQKENKKD